MKKNRKYNNLLNELKYSNFIYNYWLSLGLSENTSKVLSSLCLLPLEVKNGFNVIYIFNLFIESINWRDKYRLIPISPGIQASPIMSLFYKFSEYGDQFPKGLASHISEALSYDIDSKMAKYKGKSPTDHCTKIIKSHANDLILVRCLIENLARWKAKDYDSSSLKEFFQSYSKFFDFDHYKNKNSSEKYDYSQYKKAAAKFLTYDVGPFNNRNRKNKLKLKKFDRFAEQYDCEIEEHEYHPHQQAYRSGDIIDESKEPRYNSFATNINRIYYINSQDINARRKDKTIEYQVLFDIYLLLAFPLKLDKFISYNENTKTFIIRHEINYNHGSIHTQNHLKSEFEGLEFVHHKVKGLNFHFKLHPNISLDWKSLKEIEFENTDHSAFRNYVYDQGRIQILKYLFNSTAGTDTTHSYSAFNEDFINDEFKKSLKFLKDFIHNYSVDEIKISFDPSEEASVPYIGCEGSSPYYLCPDYFVDTILNEGNHHKDGEVTLASRRVLFQLMIGDRGEKLEKIVFIPLEEFIILLRDDKFDFRTCLILEKSFSYEAYIHNRSHNTQIINTNVLRHFGVLLIFNVFRFNSHYERMLAVKLYLGHKGYLVDSGCLSESELSVLASLQLQFIAFFKEKIWG